MALKAVLYVAGRGSRLGSQYENSHKILLEFGGKTLLEWHMEHLTKIGAKEFVVIVGHQRELVRGKLGELASKYPLKVRTIENPDFREGSVLSFHVSIPELEGAKEPILIMDGDVLYPTEMLRQLLSSKHRTALLIDREYSTADDDPVLVPIKGGRPIDFRKKWTGEADQVGESIGFFKVDPADLPFLIEQTKKRATGPGRQDSYDDVLREMVLAGRFGHEDVTRLSWTEIDFPGDIEKAEREVLPAILKLGR